MKKIIHNYWKLFVIAAAIISVDQYTKYLIMKNIALGDVMYPIPAFSSFFRFIHWYNTGVAFGMFQGMNEVFKGLAILVALVIIYFYPRIPDQEWPLKVAMSMQLAGAVGNLIDRFVVGYVVDFVSVGTFPVFNVADASITMGVVVLVIGMWIEDRREKNSKEQLNEGNGENHELIPIVDQES